ncbi:MAG TPA: hypothetical protein VM285_06965 [Polyangia bacterium]|nr:hypothetical protein [Polyangia bacterium]
MNDNRFDWQGEREKAERLSDVEIHYAILDILKTLPHADALDRELGGDRGGRYRDEISVLRSVSAARRDGPPRRRVIAHAPEVK